MYSLFSLSLSLSLSRPSFLKEKVASTWSIPLEEVVIFSTEYPKYIASHQPISDEEFGSLLEKSGGSQGHVRLYVMSVNQIKTGENVTPDTSCVEPLSEFYGGVSPYRAILGLKGLACRLSA